MKKDIIGYESIFSVILLVLFCVLLPCMELIKAQAQPWVYRLLAGVLLGSMASLAYVAVEDVIRKLRSGGWKAVQPKLRWLPVTVVTYLVVVAAGLGIWLVGWEGKGTGWVYGLGVFVGAFVVNQSVGSLLLREHQALVATVCPRCGGSAAAGQYSDQPDSSN
ncbi:MULTISPECIES: hypothetical protein [Stenotrophomonas]|uniref:hypothetical protein n=1 Tax=Stenotrophomonas TaxID=40323 RepID=UPI00115FD8ED|nr:hypothetical protein [Stenotrophomonas maltophilia]HEL4846213.1 hypothetical protein [Stenotrophomonas maltophilia]